MTGTAHCPACKGSGLCPIYFVCRLCEGTGKTERQRDQAWLEAEREENLARATRDHV
jgi:RecJ-like exonuclease